MESIIERISTDPVLMLGAAIGAVLILFVVLVVVVANLRIKTYKDRFVNVRIDNAEKEKLIASLQKELQELKIRNAQNEQELQQFAHTKEKLNDTEERLSSTQKDLAHAQKESAQVQAQNESLQGMYAALQQEHLTLKERFEDLNEENSKLRVNNARLLMKLETEERLAYNRKGATKEEER